MPKNRYPYLMRYLIDRYGYKHAKTITQKKKTKHNQSNSKIRNVIGGFFVAIGAVPPIYFSFNPHDVNIWLGFIAVSFIVIGFTIIAWGLIKSIILLIISLILIVSFLIYSIHLEGKVKILLSPNTLTTKNDSILPLAKIIIAPPTKSNQRRLMSEETRAHLGVESVVDFLHPINEKWKVIIQIINTGETPAHNVRSVSLFKLDTIVAEDFKIIRCAQKTGLFLGKRQEYTVEATTPQKTNMADSIAVFNGKNLLLVYGIIWFDDSFGTPHCLRYCLYFRPYKKDFMIYNKFNDEDKCEKN